jgi:hypothetical protein
MSPASSSPLTPVPTATLLRILIWFILIPVVLLVGLLIGVGMSWFVVTRVPALSQGAGLTLATRLVLSVSIGTATTIPIGYTWNPPLRLANRYWLMINILAMSSGVFVMTFAIDHIYDSDTFPLVWLAPAICVGAALGGFQWLFLRRRMQSAGWWILVMVSSWTILWFLVVAFVWLLSD